MVIPSRVWAGPTASATRHAARPSSASFGAPASAMPVSGIGALEGQRLPSYLPPSPEVTTRPPASARAIAPPIREPADDRRRQAGVHLRPALARVIAAIDVAAQAEDEHRVGVAGDAEVRAFVSGVERDGTAGWPDRASARGPPRRRCTGRRPRGGSHTGSGIWGFGTVEPRRPRLAAVVGAKDQVVGADHVAVLARRRTTRREKACRRPAPCCASLPRAAP